jgi:methyl-accepting chemotaxis protein
MRNFFNRITQAFRSSIRNQLSGITIAMALIPVLIISVFTGILSVSRSRAALQASTLNELEALRATKSNALSAYFAERFGDLEVSSQEQATLNALTSLNDGFNQTGASTLRALYLKKPENPNAGDGSAYSAAHQQSFTYLSNFIHAYGYYDVFLINRNGQVVFTHAKEDDFGSNLLNGKYADTGLAKTFQAALKLKKGETTISDFQFYAPSNNTAAAFTAAPIYDTSGQVVGVLAFQLPLDRITAIMQERTGLGETGETYLVGADHLFRSESRFEKNTLLKVKVDTQAVNSALSGNTDAALISDYRGTPVISAWEPVKIGNLQWAFIAEIDQSEALASANQLTTFITTTVSVAGLIVIVLALIVAFAVSRTFTQPILELRDFAAQAASGKLDISIQSDRVDELGSLASTFNSMTSQLKTTLEGLDRRAAELATVAEVGTATATILQTDRLLQEVVDLTKERFNLYHSHIYLLDEAGKNLVLASGAGEAGKQMVAEKRSIPLDREQSLVARAARERAGVTVNDVTQAADFLPNPLLPDTRSELAVPMIVGGRVIGVFDVQSDTVGRFGESDINIQTTMAAQVATSIQNVRSFEQSKAQADLETLVNSIGQKIQRATSVEDTLQTAIREIGLALGASRVSANITTRQSDSNTASRN